LRFFNVYFHISEKYLPQEEKTIRPLKVGGFAGGVKYCVAGILFKFAVDTPSSKEDRKWTYGGDRPDDHAASKIAGHELKSLVAYMNTSFVAEKLRYPFQVIIDDRGFRLIAMPLLPIDPPETLKYGSCDAGRTVHASNKDFNEQMRLAGEFLHLKPHQVGASNPQLLYSCGDIEGHVGKDGRFYLLDFSRSLPPEYQRDNNGSFDHLFKRLRPELLHLYNVCLNPDALTSFCADKTEKEKAKQDLMDATSVYLFSGSIPALADKLVKWPDSLVDNPEFSLDFEMHRLGVNMRHLGRVRAKIPEHQHTASKRMLLLREIIARTAKNTLRHLLRAKMAEIRIPSSEPYLAVSVTYYNKLLTDRNYWTDPSLLKKEANYYFPQALTQAEMAADFSLYGNMDFYKLFERIQKLSGVKLIQYAVDQLKAANIGAPGITLVKSDVRKMSVGVKTISLMNYAKAKVLFFAAEQSLCQQSAKQAERLFLLANKRFRAAHASNTLNTDILYSWGDCELAQSHLMVEPQSVDKLRSAERRFRRCSKLSEGSFNSMFANATVLLKLGSLVADEAKRSHFVAKAFTIMKELYRIKPDFAYAKVRQKALDLYHSLPQEIVTESPEPETMDFMFTNPIIYSAPEKAGNDWVPQDAAFSHAFQWHRVGLSLRRSVATMARASEILSRWAMFREQHRIPMSRDLYARAAQMFEVMLGWHPIKFTDGQKQFVIRKQDKQVLTDTMRGTTSFYSVQAENLKPDEFAVSKFRRIVPVLQHAAQYQSLERFRTLFTTDAPAPYRLSDTTHLFLDVDCGVFILKRFKCVLHSMLPNVSSQDEAFKVWLVFLPERPSKEEQLLLSSHTEAQLAFIQQKTANFVVRNEKEQDIKLNPFEAKGKWLYIRLVPGKAPVNIDEISFIGRVSVGRPSPPPPDKRAIHSATVNVGNASPRAVKEVISGQNTSPNSTNTIAGDAISVSTVTRFFSSHGDLLALSAMCQSSTLLRQIFSYVLMQRSGLEYKSAPSSIHRKKSEAPTIAYKPTNQVSLDMIQALRPSNSATRNNKFAGRTISGTSVHSSLDVEEWRLAPFKVMMSEGIASFLSSSCMLRVLDLRNCGFDENLVRSLLENARGLVSLNMKGCSAMFNPKSDSVIRGSSTPATGTPTMTPSSSQTSVTSQVGALIPLPTHPLHEAFMEFIGKSCPFLAHFAVWESCCEAALLKIVKSDTFKLVSFVDLSECSNASSKVVRKMMKSMQMVNLHRSAGDWNSDETFKKLKKPKAGGGLQAIFLGNRCDGENPTIPEILITDNIISDIVKTFPYLRHIEIVGGSITNQAVLEIGASCKNLQYLALNSCEKLTDSALADLAPKTPNLRELHLRGRRGTYGHLSISAPVLQVCSKHWTKLSALTLSRCLYMQDDGPFSAWIKATCPTLQKLDLAMCVFGDNTAEAISQCVNLTEIQLQGASISERHLSTLMENCRKLQRVGLAGTNASDDSLQRLLLIKKNSRDRLHTLLLGGCTRVTDVTLRLLTQHHAETLRFLDLRSSHVTADAVVSLLAKCPAIQLLDLGDCYRIRDIDLPAIVSLIPKTALVKLPSTKT
jgi:hypothetical protein